MKTALITGVTGMDGSYLSELLLEKEYRVYGLVRRSSSPNTSRIDHLLSHEYFTLVYGDLVDASGILQIVLDTQPDEIYNLGAMSHVGVSFKTPAYTVHADALGCLHVLEASRRLEEQTGKKSKVYQASTSELYGGVQKNMQSEETPFYPRSPYAVAKLYGFWITKNYREAYNMFACNGILFNHSSPRRGDNFVEKKIVNAAIKIKNSLQDKLYLGNLYAKRDIGHSKDYVYGMWLMLQQDSPDDYVLATGKTYAIKDIVNYVFERVGMPLTWKGFGLTEKGYNDGKCLVEISAEFFRPSEVDLLQGDASKAYKVLGWKPEYTFEKILDEMIEENSVNTKVTFSLCSPVTSFGL